VTRPAVGGISSACLRQAILSLQNFTNVSTSGVWELDAYSRYVYRPPIKLVKKGARVEQNLWPATDSTALPTTQTITVTSGKDYLLMIGAGSAVGATAVCSGAFTGTLTGDGVNPLSFPNGTAKTATTTSLTVTITGSITDIELVEVTGLSAGYTPDYHSVGVDGSDGFAQLENDASGNSVSLAGVVTFGTGAALETSIAQVPDATNLFLGLSTQSISLAIGTYVLSMHGTGSLLSSAGTATATGYGAASDGVSNTLVVTAAGTVDFTVTGSPDFIQVETEKETNPIPTDLSTVTRNATDYQFAMTQEAGFGVDGDGVELVVNGGFDSDTGWVKSTGASITGGELILSSVTEVFAYQDILEVGAVYYISVDYEITSNGAGCHVGENTGSPSGILTFPDSGSGILTGVITVASSTRFIIRDNSGVDGRFDNISLQRVKASYNEFNQLENTTIVDVTPSADTTLAGIFGIDASASSVISKDATLKSLDGTNTATVAFTADGTSKYRFRVTASSAVDELGAAGTHILIGYANLTLGETSFTDGAAVSYRGYFPSDGIARLFYGNAFGNLIHNLWGYGSILTDEEIWSKHP